MSVELSWLSATVALFLVYILGEVVTGNRQYPIKDLLGPRDGLPPAGPAFGRAKRATANMIEAMCLFVPLVLIVEATGRDNEWTALGCAIFFSLVSFLRRSTGLACLSCARWPLVLARRASS